LLDTEIQHCVAVKTQGDISIKHTDRTMGPNNADVCFNATHGGMIVGDNRLNDNTVISAKSKHFLEFFALLLGIEFSCQ